MLFLHRMFGMASEFTIDILLKLDGIESLLFLAH